jgi:hypothetical protein
MNNEDELGRYQAKTPEQRFSQIMQQECHYPPRTAAAISEEAKACFQGYSAGISIGNFFDGEETDTRKRGGGIWA